MTPGIEKSSSDVFPRTIQDGPDPELHALKGNLEDLVDFAGMLKRAGPWLTLEEFEQNLDRVSRIVDRLRDGVDRLRCSAHPETDTMAPEVPESLDAQEAIARR